MKGFDGVSWIVSSIVVTGMPIEAAKSAGPKTIDSSRGDAAHISQR